jgi:hypothetical protein
MPYVVVPAEAELQDACTELWYDPELLSDSMSIEIELATRAVLEATWAIKKLTGDRFNGKQCWSDDYQIRYDQRRLQIYKDVGRVLYVAAVSPCSDTETELTNACHIGNGLIRLGCPHNSLSGTCCGPYIEMGDFSACESRYIRVIYQTKANVPPGADRVVMQLAREYVYAACGDKKCRLPERITSVTRQSVSWTILDPQEFLDRGLIGIGSIDHWLNVVNQDTRGLSMRDPLSSGIKRSSVLIGCGDDCDNDANPETDNPALGAWWPGAES